jgi:hypothetical protein
LVGHSSLLFGLDGVFAHYGILIGGLLGGDSSVY